MRCVDSEGERRPITSAYALRMIEENETNLQGGKPSLMMGDRIVVVLRSP